MKNLFTIIRKQHPIHPGQIPQQPNHLRFQQHFGIPRSQRQATLRRTLPDLQRRPQPHLQTDDLHHQRQNLLLGKWYRSEQRHTAHRSGRLWQNNPDAALAIHSSPNKTLRSVSNPQYCHRIQYKRLRHHQQIQRPQNNVFRRPRSRTHRPLLRPRQQRNGRNIIWSPYAMTSARDNVPSKQNKQTTPNLKPKRPRNRRPLRRRVRSRLREMVNVIAFPASLPGQTNLIPANLSAESLL
jgi:hypothetical protein